MTTTPAAKPVRVFLAEDHALVRQGFRRMLEDDPRLQVVGEASTGLAAVAQCAQLKPDVVVMDISMPELGGLEATAEILKADPDIRVLILSMYSNPAYVKKAFDSGARGYVLKDALEVDLAQAVLTIARGEAYMSSAVSNLMIQNLKTGNMLAGGDAFDTLTLREKEVLQLIVGGKSNKEIAILLGISPNTVAVHRAHLMDRLGIHRTAELVLYALEKGLVQPK